MTIHRDSLENESELVKIVKNNEFFEKKIANFEVQSDDLDRNISLFTKCSGQVKKIAENANRQLKTLEKNVEIQKIELPAILKEAELQVDKTFQKMGSIDRSAFVKVSTGNPSLSISLPLDEHLQKSQKTLDGIQKRLDDHQKNDALLKSETAELRKEQESTARALRKVEKESTMLKNDLQKRNDTIAARQMTSSENQKRLTAVQAEFEERMRKKEEAEKKLQIAQDSLETLKSTRNANESNEISSKLASLQSLTALLAEPLTPALLLELQLIENSDLKALFSEIASYFAENPHLPAAIDFPEYSESESVEKLTSELKKVKKEKKAVLHKVKEMRQGKEKYDVAAKALDEKKEELEAIHIKIARHEAIIKEREVLAKSVHPVSLLNRRSNVIRRPSYRVPDGQMIPKTSKKTSLLTADFTESVIENSQVYPGIRVIQEESVVEEEDNVSMNASDDVFIEESSLTEETGTTQDDDGIDDFFGALDNQPPPQPAPVEFSMTQHMAEFEKREEKAKAEKLKKTMQEALEEHDDDDLDLSIMASSVKNTEDDDDDILDMDLNETGVTQDSTFFSDNFKTPPSKGSKKKKAAAREISPIMSQRATRNKPKVNYNEEEKEENDDGSDNESIFVPKKAKKSKNSKKKASLDSDDSDYEDANRVDQSSYGSDD